MKPSPSGRSIVAGCSLPKVSASAYPQGAVWGGGITPKIVTYEEEETED